MNEYLGNLVILLNSHPVTPFEQSQCGDDFAPCLKGAAAAAVAHLAHLLSANSQSLTPLTSDTQKLFFKTTKVIWLSQWPLLPSLESRRLQLLLGVMPCHAIPSHSRVHGPIPFHPSQPPASNSCLMSFWHMRDCMHGYSNKIANLLAALRKVVMNLCIECL